MWFLMLAPMAVAADWAGQLQVVTDAPIHLGVRGQIEGPARLRANTSIGWMPPGYVDLLNIVIVGFGGYDETTAALVDAALKNSLVWRTHVGWRPLDAGWFVESGYGLATLGGGVGAAEIIEAATGEDYGASVDGYGFDIRTSAHMVDVVTGWEQHFGRVILRADIGGSFTVAARSRVERDFPAARRSVIADAVETGAEEYLNTTLKRWGHSPTIGLAVGIELGKR